MRGCSGAWPCSTRTTSSAARRRNSASEASDEKATCGVSIAPGWVASAGALIYAEARSENRYALTKTRFLIQQPLGGMGGRASDIEIEATQIVKMRERLNRIFARATTQDYEKIVRDTERNFWMSAKEACAYGLVHRVV